LLAFPWQLKFVVRTASQRQLDCDLREIDQQLELIPIADSDRERVLLMPQCIDADTLVEAYRMLVPICQARGFRIGQRLHIALFGHTPGT
jgi:7-carboxy-7-deazaguanine synthase